MINKLIAKISENRWLILILLAAAFLRFYNLGFQSIWMDEIYTMNIASANESFATLISEVTIREGFPYIYFLTLKVLFHIFGYDPIVARAFSAVFGIAAIYMIYVLGRQLSYKKVGLIAAALFCVSEYSITTSQDGRPYSLYVFAVILSYYALVKFLKNYSLRNGILYGLSAALLLNVNFFSFINLFAQAILILFFIVILPSRERLLLFKRSAIAGLIAIVLFLPNYPILAKLLVFKSSWIPAPTNQSVSQIFNEFIGDSEMTAFIFIPLFFYFLFEIFKSQQTTTYQQIIANQNVFSFLILASWSFILIMIIFLKSHLDTSLMVSRYFISLIPVFLLIFAFAITFIKNNIVGYSVLFMLITLMLANNLAVRNYYWSPSRTQFEPAAAFVIDQNKNGEPVYTSLKYWYDYFFIQAGAAKTIEKPSLEVLMQEMMQDSLNLKPFWYVEAHGRPFSLSEKSAAFAARHFYLEDNYDGLDAWGRHYVLSDDAPKSDIARFIPIKATNGHGFNSSVEVFENDGNRIKASGWAYFEGQSARQNRVTVFVIQGNVSYPMRTNKVQRPDVTSYFKSDFSLDNAGFQAEIDISKLAAGRYTIAIHLINKETSKEGLVLTDKFFDK